MYMCVGGGRSVGICCPGGRMGSWAVGYITLQRLVGSSSSSCWQCRRQGDHPGRLGGSRGTEVLLSAIAQTAVTQTARCQSRQM